MKVKLYMDLSDLCIVNLNNENIMAASSPMYSSMKDMTRYVLEVDLPIRHFKVIADREVEAVVIGKEEK